MKYVILVVIFVVGCAGSTQEIQNPEPLSSTQDQKNFEISSWTESRWPNHFVLDLQADHEMGGEDVRCDWRLEIERTGPSFRVTGVTAYPPLPPITTRKDYEATIKRMACIMPSFTLNAESLVIEDVTDLEGVADLKEALMNYHALRKPKEEVLHAVDEDLNFVTRRTANNLTLLWQNIVPPTKFDELKAGQVFTGKDAELRVGQMTTFGGHECLEVTIDIHEFDEVDTPEMRASSNFCFSSKLFLNLFATMHMTLSETPIVDGKKSFIVKTIQILE